VDRRKASGPHHPADGGARTDIDRLGTQIVPKALAHNRGLTQHTPGDPAEGRWHAPVSAAAPRITPTEIFTARAEARAMLFRVCELGFYEAVDVLQRAAERDGLVDAIGQDGVQRIMSQAFEERVR
jgi:hypothetical protein